MDCAVTLYIHRLSNCCLPVIEHCWVTTSWKNVLRVLEKSWNFFCIFSMLVQENFSFRTPTRLWFVSDLFVSWLTYQQDYLKRYQGCDGFWIRIRRIPTLFPKSVGYLKSSRVRFEIIVSVQLCNYFRKQQIASTVHWLMERSVVFSLLLKKQSQWF